MTDRSVQFAHREFGSARGVGQWSAVTLFLWLCLSISAGLAAEVESAFELGNRLYEQGKFAEAASAYERVLDEQGASAELHFNLGNALFKAGQPGRAIWHYRVAERLSPRDPDIQANLRFARDSVGGGTFRQPLWQQWLDHLSLNEWAGLFGLALWLCLGVLVVRLIWPQRKASLRGVTAAGIVSLALAAVCLAAAAQSRLGTKPAVIVVKEAVARYGPLPESESRFTLRDGQEVEILDRKEDWVQVADAQGHAGWVRQEHAQALP